MEEMSPSSTPSKSPWRWVPALLIMLIMAASLWSLPPGPDRPAPIEVPPPPIPPIPSSPYRNTGTGVAYVGDEVCARCHAEIARTYRSHSMGQSMSVPAGSKPEANGEVFKVADLVYSVLRRGDRVFHREAKQDDRGQTVAANEHEVRYVLGSGRRGRSYLVERGNGLFQSPITWYAHAGRWDLSPRYEVWNGHFDRPITAGCLYCHTNRVEMAEDRPPVFHGMAIGCERCHGPGELHARRPEMVNGRDWTIVNPANLEPRALRESVCEQCHLQGSTRANQPGRSIADYRPGLPLDAFVRVFYSRGDPVTARGVIGHVEQMRESRCFQRSGGELGCVSCHDPHRLPAAGERVAYYRGRCLECHADRGCTVPKDDRLAGSPDDDCTACHMPRTRALDVAHTAITLHTIPRHSPAPAASGTTNP
jgi:hypothetical protein